MSSDLSDPASGLSVVQLVAPGAVGGLESVVRALASGLHQRGHRVVVVSTVAQDAVEAFHRPLRESGVEVVMLRFPGRAYLRERAAIRHELVRIRPQVVHAHGYRPVVLAGDLARDQGIPGVATVHGFTGGDWKNRLFEGLQCRALRRFDAVVAVSRPLVRRLTATGVSADRVHYLPNAWGDPIPPLDRAAARRALGVPDEGFLVGWVGRLSHEKGPDLLLQALGRIRDLPVMAAVIGDGPQLSGLRSQAEGLGLTDRIRWYGVVPEAGRLFRAFDVLVLSSRTEGTPIVLLEAMGAAVPIVATRVGGVPDLLGAEHAVLVPAADPTELAAALRQVFLHPDTASVRAEAARERLTREYGRDPWITAHEHLYRSLVSQASLRPAP